jgi:hypothetical protein
MERMGMSDMEGKAVTVTARECGNERISIMKAEVKSELAAACCGLPQPLSQNGWVQVSLSR